MAELKPCPFCEIELERVSRCVDGHPFTGKCFLDGVTVDVRTQAKHWNTRPQQTEKDPESGLPHDKDVLMDAESGVPGVSDDQVKDIVAQHIESYVSLIGTDTEEQLHDVAFAVRDLCVGREREAFEAGYHSDSIGCQEAWRLYLAKKGGGE